MRRRPEIDLVCRHFVADDRMRNQALKFLRYAESHNQPEVKGRFEQTCIHSTNVAEPSPTVASVSSCRLYFFLLLSLIEIDLAQLYIFT